jgi:hypothetical protein
MEKRIETRSATTVGFRLWQPHYPSLTTLTGLNEIPDPEVCWSSF